MSFIVCHLFRILSFDDTLLGGGVTYSRPILYASYPIRVALPLSRFPLRFALTYPRRLSCPLPRPLICQLSEALRFVELSPLIGCLLFAMLLVFRLQVFAIVIAS